MTQPSIPTLNYATPASRSPRWFYILDLIIVSILMGGLSLGLLLWVPRFSDVFGELKTWLPLPAELLLDLSDAFYHNYLWLAAIAIAFIAPFPIARVRRRCRCDQRNSSAVVFIFAEIASVIGILGIAYAAVGYCLMSAIAKLMESISPKY